MGGCNSRQRDKCSICQEDIIPKSKNSLNSACCDKIFHCECWDKWIEQNSSCPLCRKSTIPEYRQETIRKINRLVNEMTNSHGNNIQLEGNNYIIRADDQVIRTNRTIDIY
tara:strand:+ start:594 stop:926 length:333 start_codon:yes stop_codon:yes gene_type:complete